MCGQVQTAHVQAVHDVEVLQDTMQVCFLSTLGGAPLRHMPGFAAVRQVLLLCAVMECCEDSADSQNMARPEKRDMFVLSAGGVLWNLIHN
jgi:hypothetical protein